MVLSLSLSFSPFRLVGLAFVCRSSREERERGDGNTSPHTAQHAHTHSYSPVVNRSNPTRSGFGEVELLIRQAPWPVPSRLDQSDTLQIHIASTVSNTTRDNTQREGYIKGISCFHFFRFSSFSFVSAQDTESSWFETTPVRTSPFNSSHFLSFSLACFEIWTSIDSMRSIRSPDSYNSFVCIRHSHTDSITIDSQLHPSISPTNRNARYRRPRRHDGLGSIHDILRIRRLSCR